MNDLNVSSVSVTEKHVEIFDVYAYIHICKWKAAAEIHVLPPLLAES